jgi:hypothetical protein
MTFSRVSWALQRVLLVETTSRTLPHLIGNPPTCRLTGRMFLGCPLGSLWHHGRTGSTSVTGLTSHPGAVGSIAAASGEEASPIGVAW